MEAERSRRSLVKQQRRAGRIARQRQPGGPSGDQAEVAEPAAWRGKCGQWRPGGEEAAYAVAINAIEQQRIRKRPGSKMARKRTVPGSGG